ncbi:hypothetical protein [Capnocytophaga sputigena]|uniref:hypothetical protein n=1 Tax=Capnocytophaga sputigena TaxID=1019 RepID=UPI0028D353EE|nr:hypothetical protein [Capnocytophaga sputigena]
MMIAANGKKLIMLKTHKADGVNILMKKYALAIKQVLTSAGYDKVKKVKKYLLVNLLQL